MQYSNIRQSFRNEAVAHIEYCCWQNYDLWIEWACLEHRRTVTKKALANGGMSWTNLVDDRSGLILWCCWSARSIVSPVTYSNVDSKTMVHYRGIPLTDHLRWNYVPRPEFYSRFYNFHQYELVIIAYLPRSLYLALPHCAYTWLPQTSYLERKEITVFSTRSGVD